jgi:hypothetical protein
MLRDGAMAAAHIDRAEDIGPIFLRGVEGLLSVLHADPDDAERPRPRWPG